MSRVGALIERQFLLLESTPEIGRPLEQHPELRELLIGFGEAGYMALYHHVPGEKAVFVLAFCIRRKPATDAGYKYANAFCLEVNKRGS